MRKFFFIIVLIFPLFICNLALARSPYIREDSIGTIEPEEIPKKIPRKYGFTFIPIQLWKGERFIFLPKSKSLQKYGYMDFKGGDGKYGYPTYKSYVGRIATVIDVQKEKKYGWYKEKDKYNVTFKMEDNDHILTARAYHENISGIALVEDIDKARAKWLGKTLWVIREPNLYGEIQLLTYNAEIDEIGSIKVKKFSLVKVVDIVAGWELFCSPPICFILRTPSGEEGYISLNLSGTNVSESFKDSDQFDMYFAESDPRKKSQKRKETKKVRKQASPTYKTKNKEPEKSLPLSLKQIQALEYFISKGRWNIKEDAEWSSKARQLYQAMKEEGLYNSGLKPSWSLLMKIRRANKKAGGVLTSP